MPISHEPGAIQPKSGKYATCHCSNLIGKLLGTFPIASSNVISLGKPLELGLEDLKKSEKRLHIQPEKIEIRPQDILRWFRF
jgi:hypothetical protein